MNPGASLAWRALKTYRCPKCGGPLEKSAGGHGCAGTSNCTFYITQARFDDLVAKLQAGPKAPPAKLYPSHGEEENRNYLNSL